MLIEIFPIDLFFICDKTTSTTQTHAVSMTRESWKLGVFGNPEALRFWTSNWRNRKGFLKEMNTEN